MAKAVGLSRKLTLRWLNYAVDLLEENLSEDEYKARINDYLSYEIDSPTVLRKTREILMRVWYYEDDQSVKAIREEALKLIKRYPDFDFVFHWCMLLVEYPVFADVCKIMGRIEDYNGTITNSLLKQKLFDEWGERTTLFHSTDKIIATMKELGAISNSKPGYYTVNKRTINNPEIVSFVLVSAMKVDGGSYYSFSELTEFETLFPFEYSIIKESIFSDSHFLTTHFSGEMTVSIK